MAGQAFRDPRVADLVAQEAVPILVDILDPAEAKWVQEHGVQLTPHVVIADAEGEQWAFLSDVHSADDVLAAFAEARLNLAEFGGK